MLPGSSAFLRPPYHQVVCRLSNKKLSVWSNFFLSLFPALQRHLSKVRAEQKKVPYWGWSCVLLMRFSQDGWPTRSFSWRFEQTWSETRPSVSLLTLGISSFFPLCICSHRSPGLWPFKNRSIQPHSWPLRLWRDLILPLGPCILFHWWSHGNRDEPYTRSHPLLENEALYLLHQPAY